MTLVMVIFSLAATSVLVLLATSWVGPLINRPAGTRRGERGDVRDEAPWSAPWEHRTTPDDGGLPEPTGDAS